MIPHSTEACWEAVGTLHRCPRGTATLENFEELLVDDSADQDIPLLIYDIPDEGHELGKRNIPRFIAQKIKMPSSEQKAAADDEKKNNDDSDLRVVRTAVVNCVACNSSLGSDDVAGCASAKRLGSNKDNGHSDASLAQKSCASCMNSDDFCLSGLNKRQRQGCKDDSEDANELHENDSIQLVTAPPAQSRLFNLVLVAGLAGDAGMWLLFALTQSQKKDGMIVCCAVNILSIFICAALILYNKAYSITTAMYVIICSIMFSLYMYIYETNRIIYHIAVLTVVFIILVRLHYNNYPSIYFL